MNASEGPSVSVFEMKEEVKATIFCIHLHKLEGHNGGNRSLSISGNPSNRHARINNSQFNLSVTYKARSFGFSRTIVLDGVHYRTKNVSVERGTRTGFIK
jgi:hypothetical protein